MPKLKGNRRRLSACFHRVDTDCPSNRLPWKAIHKTERECESHPVVYDKLTITSADRNQLGCSNQRFVSPSLRRGHVLKAGPAISRNKNDFDFLVLSLGLSL